MVELPVHPLPLSGDTPALVSAPAATLTVGALDITPKEQTLLRSLVRLLDGRGGLALHFADDVAHCDVVFVPDGWARRLAGSCVCVHLRADGAATPEVLSTGIAVSPPLRATNVMAALDAAAALLPDRAAASHRGAVALFQLLTRLSAARERRTTVTPLGTGADLCVDFATGLAYGPLSRDELLAGAYTLGEPHRASAEEAESFKAHNALRVRDLIWSLAHALGETGVPAAELRGRYLLQRWPDAVALSRPGYPRLAALLTNRAMSCEDASAASALSPHTVRWFLAAGLALGIAAPDETTDHAPLQKQAPQAAQQAAQAPHHSLLGRLRERLKLW